MNTKDHPTLSDEHIQQLHTRGFLDDTIKAAGFWSASRDTATHILGFDPQSGGLVIPHFHPMTGEKVLDRIRLDIPMPGKDGKTARYLSPKGARNHIYFPPGAKEWINDATLRIGVTEGEFKALWAWQERIPYIGFDGVWSWRQKGRNPIISDMDLITWKDREVIITYDSDIAINEKVQQAEEKLAYELYRRHVKIIYRHELQPDANGEKVGLDDFLNKHGLLGLDDLDVEIVPSPFPQFERINVSLLLDEPIIRPPSIIDGWGIRRDGKVILTAAGGTGKSTLLLQCAWDLAAGKPLFGHIGLAVNGSQRVLLFMAEDPKSEVQFRLQEQMQALHYTKEVAENIMLLNAKGGKLLVTLEFTRNELFDALREHNADVCILDPLIAVHDRDENNNSEMRMLLDTLQPYQEETGCTFILAHHEPKMQDKNEGVGGRGASSIRDWARTFLKLTPNKRNANGSQCFELKTDKANYGGSVHQLTLIREKDSYIFTPIEEEDKATPIEIWEFVGPDGIWIQELKNLLCKEKGFKETTATKVINKAVEKGFFITRKIRNEKTNNDRTFVFRLTSS